MKSKINQIILVVVVGLTLFQMTHAAPFLGPLVQCGRGDNPADACQIGDLFRGVYMVINFLVGSATILAMAYIVYGGVRMILALGNKAEVDKARTTMTNAIYGLLIVLISYLIVGSATVYFTGKSFKDILLFLPSK